MPAPSYQVNYSDRTHLRPFGPDLFFGGQWAVASSMASLPRKTSEQIALFKDPD